VRPVDVQLAVGFDEREDRPVAGGEVGEEPGRDATNTVLASVWLLIAAALRGIELHCERWCHSLLVSLSESSALVSETWNGMPGRRRP